MTTKSLGPAVSGYLDPDGRSFENVVHQAGKPVLDKELNLGADLNAGFSQALLRQLTPSGWVSGDFTAASTLYQSSADLDTLAMPKLLAHVNGWLLPIVHTGLSGSNKVNFGVAPVGVGAKRTDFVVLEVWRRLLDATTATGKSGTGRIWVNGNVKVAPADDATLNLVDDMLDGVVAAETTRRVQIQYRLRTIQNVDIFSYVAGLDDPTVVANTVPTNAATPDGTATIFAFSNQSANGDPGLWRAGDGVPTNGLGTVDGYMYAIPLGAVFRRNSSAFSKNLNQNGGVASGGPSDRPDGLFYDLIAARDLADLRRGVSLGVVGYQEALEKNFGALLDNALQTEWAQLSVGGGQHGHTFLAADEVGLSNANGGDGSINGDTPGANFIGEFDFTRRRFSDRVVYEVMTVRVVPGTAAVSTATWQNGTVVTLNPMALAPYPHSAFNFPAHAPSNTRIVDVLRARIMGQSVGKRYCEVGLSTDVDTSPVPIVSLSGLGEFPMANVVLTLGTPPVALTDEPMFVDLLIAYPPGQGLTYTPTGDYGAGSYSLNNPGALPATPPVNFSAPVGPSLDAPHREVNFEYTTVPLSFTFRADGTGSRTTFQLPERVETIIQILKNAGAASGNVDSTKRLLTLTADAAPGDEIQIDYRARRPIPQTGAQYTVYYESRVPQTIRSALLGTSVTLIPRFISPYVYSISTGSGSIGEGYPYPFAYVQSGAVYPSALGSFSGDHQLDGAAQLSVANFGAETGFLRLPAVIPYSPGPNGVTLQRLVGDTDAEGRSYYKAVPGGSYLPNAYAQPLSDTRIHKVVLPTLMETTVDSLIGRKGTLVMVVFTRWAPADNENSVRLSADLNVNTTSASIFRLSGNLLNRKV